MAKDVDRTVNTEFNVTGNAAGQAGKLGSQFQQLGGVLGRVTSMINPLNMAMTALGGAFSMGKILSVGSEFEGLQIGMAQTLKFMGQGGKTWNDAMSNADITMQRINAAAAALPGEAEDYQMAMQLAGSNVNKATHDFDRSFKLIKDMTAVGISMGGNAQLTAVELNRMLNVNQGMMERTSDFSMKLLTAMQQLPGHASLTTVEFNKMKLEDRLKLVESTAGQFDDMIAASSSTWEAVSGAATSALKQITVQATKPIFAQMKKGVDAFANALFNAQGQLTPLGQQIVDVGKVIGENVVKGVEMAIAMTKKLGQAWTKFAESPAMEAIKDVLDKMAVTMGRIGGSMGAATGVIAPGGQEDASRAQQAAGAGGAGVAAMAGLGPLAIILTGAFGTLASNGDAVSSILGSLGGIVNTLVDAMMPMIDYFFTLSTMLGDVAAVVLPPFVEVINMLLGALLPFWEQIFNISNVFAQKLKPSVMMLAGKIGTLIKAIGTFLMPIIRILGAVLTWVYRTFLEGLMPAIKKVSEWLGKLMDALSAFLRWLGKIITIAANEIAPDKADSGALGDIVRDLKQEQNYGTRVTPDREFVPGAVGAKPGAAGAAGKGARGGGGRSKQDFRYSRFEITQKFAEGFDPDRIAVSFGRDVGRLGEQRLQSGFEPLFSIK